jgi:hypothetical protein
VACFDVNSNFLQLRKCQEIKNATQQNYNLLKKTAAFSIRYMFRPYWAIDRLSIKVQKFVNEGHNSESKFKTLYPVSALNSKGHLWTADSYTRSNVQPSTACPTRYRTLHFFNNFTTNEDIRRTTDTHYRHTLQTHSSSFLTQRTYPC